MKRQLLLFFSILLFCSINVIAQTVYVTRTGSKYHNDGCRYLSQSKIAIDLTDAISKGYGPCSVCKPPTQPTKTSKASQQTEKNETSTNQQKSETTSTQCAAITQAGIRCTRKAEPGSIYCWQHQGYGGSTPTSTQKPTTTTKNTGTSSGTSTSGRTIYTGPRGGKYYINSSGNKTYIKR